MHSKWIIWSTKSLAIIFLIVLKSSIKLVLKAKASLSLTLILTLVWTWLVTWGPAIFLHKILASFIAQDGTHSGNEAAYWVFFTTQYVGSSLVYCISSQSCNENNFFMGFFPSASIYLCFNNQYESLQLSKKNGFTILRFKIEDQDV